MAFEEVVKKFRIHSKDTSSADVRIGVYTEEVRDLLEKFQRTQDLNYRIKATKLLIERRKLLDYLSQTDVKRYESVKSKMKEYE